jgi:glycine/D-amino acid oxidase-like deaminating enzyme
MRLEQPAILSSPRSDDDARSGGSPPPDGTTPTSSTLALDVPTCLYTSTARDAVATPSLRGSTRTQVAIVGAGYTGLSAALHLAEQGRAVVVVEAREPGWGAAGRNGGQVNPGLKHEPDDVERHLGAEAGSRLVRLAADAPAYLFGLIERLGIDCECERGGTLRAAYHDSQVADLVDSAEQWRHRGVELGLSDRSRIHALTGTQRYLAALFDPRGGSVNPLGLARGLAAAGLQAGAQIYGMTPAVGLERSRAGWRIKTAHGAVHADAVVIATDGYSDGLWPGLRTSIVPVYSAIAATEPLPAALAAAIMPTRAVLYEIGAVTAYYRRDTGGRLLMGGRGVQRAATRLSDYRHLVRYAERLWPDIRRVQWTHWWNGQFALTPDFYPRLHAPAPGVFVALGYSGRGVALATSMGKVLAAALGGAAHGDLAIPVTPIRRIPLHAFWRLGVAGRVAYGRLRDAVGI